MSSTSYDEHPCGILNGDSREAMQKAHMAKIITGEALKIELEKPGRSQSALGRAMGLKPEQVNRICAGTRQIKAAELPLIEHYLEATGSAPFRTEAVATVRIVGAVEAGAWREPGLDVLGEFIPVVATLGDADLFALRVAGASMNLKYDEGSYVIVRPWQGGPWPVGKNVVVQRTDAAGKIETTLKELVMGERGLELWPRSSDPRFQEAVAFSPTDDTIEIIGRVVSSWRAED